MLPPPPRSTLFPYTTLFRSGQAGRIFTRPALRLIHRHSGGVPRLINMIAHRAMVAAFADDRRTVRRRSVRQAYNEIAVVPLPGRRRASRWAALSTVGAAACLAVIAVGAARLSPPPDPASVPAPEPVAPNVSPSAPAAEAQNAAPSAPAPADEAPRDLAVAPDTALVATAPPAAIAPPPAPPGD